MGIHYYEIMSERPIPIRIVFSRVLTSAEQDGIATELAACSNTNSIVGVAVDLFSSREIALRIPWSAKDALPLYMDLFTERSPAVRDVIVGWDGSLEVDERFVHVPDGKIEMTMGDFVDVAKFNIRKHPISYGEFWRFVSETEYLTIAERGKRNETYRSNSVIESITELDRMASPVNHVCYLDALAYCQWAKVRLPKEEEWVAAALLDRTWYTSSREASKHEEELQSRPEALVRDGPEITGTTIDNKQVVIRQGPFLTRTTNPKMIRTERFIWPVDYSARLQFRVCQR